MLNFILYDRSIKVEVECQSKQHRRKFIKSIIANIDTTPNNN